MDSTSSYVSMLVGSVISLETLGQTIVASSTIEVQFIAYHEATSQMI